jgi:hypothetical protein
MFEFEPVEPSENCPCCGQRTLFWRGEYEVCPVCGWEDDGVADDHPDQWLGGPNGISLVEGRENFRRFGRSDRPSGP